MKTKGLLILLLLAFISHFIMAQDASPVTNLQVRFTNVNLFNGLSDKMLMNANVLIENNLIKQVSAGAISAPNATKIDDGGRTLMPGLADTHVHLAFGSLPQVQMMTGLNEYNVIHATVNASELFKMSGLRNPCNGGDLGVIKEGAYADLLLVEGNPLEDLNAVTNADNIKIVMKDGKIYKNTIK